MGDTHTTTNSRVPKRKAMNAGAGKKKINNSVHEIVTNPIASLSGDPKIVYEVTKRRLSRIDFTPTDQQIIEHLKGYLLKRERGGNIHLDPISTEDMLRLVSIVTRSEVKLSAVLTHSATSWLSLIPAMMEQIKQGYEAFKRVAIEQAQEDWKDDNRWKVILYTVAKIVVSAALAGVGFGSLGGFLGEVCDNAMGEAIAKGTKEAVKGGIAGATGELGAALVELGFSYYEPPQGGEVPQLAASSQQQSLQIAKSTLLAKLATLPTSDPERLLNEMQQMLIESYGQANKLGTQLVLNTINEFKLTTVKHMAWQVVFNSNSLVLPEYQICRDTEQLLTLTFSQIHEDLNRIFVCPYKVIEPARAKQIVEKFCWAVYIDERFKGEKKRHLGNSVINRLAELKVGRRRDELNIFMRESRFIKEKDQVVKDLQAIDPKVTDKAKQLAQLTQLETAEQAMQFGKRSGGAITDAQLSAWAKTYRDLEPLRMLFMMEQDVSDQMASGSAELAVKLKAWKEAHARAKAAATHIALS